jgi:uncharacterized membrane protein HdeD (DUF308 family)
MSGDTALGPAQTKRRVRFGAGRVRGIAALLFGCLAIMTPFFAGPLAFFVGGLLLIACGVLELLETYRAPDPYRLRSTYLGGELSILAGILLLSIPELVLKGVSLVLAVSFLLDGVGKGMASLRAKLQRRKRAWLLVAGAVNIALALILISGWPLSGWAVVGVVIGVRMLTAGWSMLLGKDPPPGAAETSPEQHPDVHLRLPPHPAIAKLNTSLGKEEDIRRVINIYWCLILVFVFFAVHLGRMRVYWNKTGMIDPLVAVAGDVGMALLVAFCIVLPLRLLWHKLTRPLERRGWRKALARIDAGRSPGLLDRLCQSWLRGRMRFSRRLFQMRRSLRAALRWGLQVGLPVIAILVAISPIWGLNYFFNTETWASGIWHKWAAVRTDTWREQMISALRHHYQDKNIPEDRLFRVDPPGALGSEDFSFLVLGDNGDGGAAQHSLRDQYILLGQRSDMKFMVISSDVIYPDGAMRDYESNFYLPVKGFTKPVYAIPGNHDWYDALEGFAANFLEAEAGRVCMLSRLDTDNRNTAASRARIEGYIGEADRLRKTFGVKTGLQRGPFFEVQTARFALIAVDTGVLKTVDSAQWNWFKGALERSRGKFRMVILGHPLFTAGHYQGDPDHLTGEWTPPLRSPLAEGGDTAPFTAIHHLLRKEHVEVVMAGDMHYFEHYQEFYEDKGSKHTMEHFVNGGGGAYIVVGLPFDWPRTPDLPVWTYFPRRDAVTEKLDAQTPTWKMPLWLWVKHYSAWPFTAYIMSAAFDHNKAPYFQSFVEVQVRNSKNEVCFVPHSADGPLRWRDLENFRSLMPAKKTENDPVEFIVKMPPR